VRDLLAYALIATEEDRPSSVALDEDLETALTHLCQAIEESGAQITHDPLPTLQVDRGQMVRLFQNLVGNAVKYRKPDEPPKVHISAELAGPEWVISGRDNGIGFEPEYESSRLLKNGCFCSQPVFPGSFSSLDNGYYQGSIGTSRRLLWPYRHTFDPELTRVVPPDCAFEPNCKRRLQR